MVTVVCVYNMTKLHLCTTSYLLFRVFVVCAFCLHVRFLLFEKSITSICYTHLSLSRCTPSRHYLTALPSINDSACFIRTKLCFLTSKICLNHKIIRVISLLLLFIYRAFFSRIYSLILFCALHLFLR